MLLEIRLVCFIHQTLKVQILIAQRLHEIERPQVASRIGVALPQHVHDTHGTRGGLSLETREERTRQASPARIALTHDCADLFFGQNRTIRLYELTLQDSPIFKHRAPQNDFLNLVYS